MWGIWSIWGSIYDGWCADQQLRRQETDCKPAHCILLSPTLYCQSFLADTVPQYFLQPANVSLYHIRVYRVSSFFGRYISSIFTCPLYLIITHTLLPEFFWQIHFLQGGSFLHQCHCILLSHRCIQSIFIFWLIYFLQAGQLLVDRPTQLICISDIYLSTDKYKRHSRAICPSPTLDYDHIGGKDESYGSKA